MCKFLSTSLLVHSLGMKDSWGPLKALAVASAVNGIGDIVLCTFLGYGIAGAAWATMVSQVRKIKISDRHNFLFLLLFLLKKNGFLIRATFSCAFKISFF